MKKLITFFLFLMFTSNVMAAPAGQAVVDRYVGLAQAIDESDILKMKGAWTCSFPVIHDSSWKVSGKNQTETVTGLMLLCIKHRCEDMKAEMEDAVAKILNIPEQDYRDLLEFIGKIPEEIEAALTNRKNGVVQIKNPLNCTNSASYRMVVFDSCYSVPVECSEKKSFFSW